MGINRPKAEEIVVKLRQVEVLMAQGMVRLDAMRLGSMAATPKTSVLSRLMYNLCVDNVL